MPAWEITMTDGERKTEPILAETPDGIAQALSGIAAALSLLPPPPLGSITIAVERVED
jgi:hypothetical protein